MSDSTSKSFETYLTELALESMGFSFYNVHGDRLDEIDMDADEDGVEPGQHGQTLQEVIGLTVENEDAPPAKEARMENINERRMTVDVKKQRQGNEKEKEVKGNSQTEGHKLSKRRQTMG